MARTDSVRLVVIVMLFVAGSRAFAQFEQIVVEDARQGSGTEIVRAIVDSVSNATGEKIYTNGKENLLQHTVTLSTNSAAARDLLSQVLAGTPERRLSWKLLFQLEYGYVLNIVNLAVPAERRQ